MAPTGWPFASSPPDGIDRNVAADQRTAFSGPFGAHAAGDEPEVLAVDDLGHGKAVVKLDEVDVLGVHACGLVGALRGLHRRIEGDDVLMAADPGRAAGLHGGQHVDGEIRRALRAVLGNHNDGGGPITYRTAVIELDRIGDRLRLPDDVRG